MANTEGFFDRFHPLYGSYRKDQPASVEVADQALAFTPVGTADAVSEIVEEGRQDDPNYLQMGLMGLAEVLGYAPAIGPAVKTMARKTPDFVSEFLNKRKSEIIPAEKIDGIILSGKADNKSANEINKQVLETAEREKIPHPKRAFDNPKVEYVDTKTIADNVAQFNFPRYDVGKFGGDLPSGNLSENPFLQEKFDASGQETLKENIFNEGIKEPIEVEVVLSDGGISISEGHHRLQAAIELGIPEVPVVVTTKAKPRAAGIEVMRPATLDTGGLQSGQTYSFSELGLEQRLRRPKETPEEIRSRGGTVFSDFDTGEVSDRKFPQYITPMREGYYRKTEGFAEGGEVMSGIGSLNETARAMTRGPRGIGSYIQYMADGGSVVDTASRVVDHASLGDIEYRADLEPHMDPLAEMGFDVNKIDYDMMYDRSNNRLEGSHFNPNNDRILISPGDYSSKGVAAHEMRHRGLERLFRIVEQGYPTAKKLGLSKEDYLKILRLYKLDQQQDRQRRVNDPDFEYSGYAHEKIAEGFEKDETINRGAQYFLSNPNAPLFTFDREERRPRTPAERLLLMQDALRENAMSGEQAFGPDLSIKKFTPSPTSMEAFRETEGRAEIERYLNEGPQNTPEGITTFAEQAMAAQRYADIINERNKTIQRNTSQVQNFKNGGEVDKNFLQTLVKGVVMAESSGDPKAENTRSGALGLMQIRPSTARKPGYGVEDIFTIAERLGYDTDDKSDRVVRQLLFVPEVNVELGSQYLQAMLEKFPRTEDALRAYNAGPGKFAEFKASGKPLSALSEENRGYPLKVVAAVQGVNPNEPREMAAFKQSPASFSAMETILEPASSDMVMYSGQGSARVNPIYAEMGPRPTARPTPTGAAEVRIDQVTGQPVVVPPAESLYEKYSPENMAQDALSGIGGLNGTAREMFR